jgi:hypothetical protein
MLWIAQNVMTTGGESKMQSMICFLKLHIIHFSKLKRKKFFGKSIDITGLE